MAPSVDIHTESATDHNVKLGALGKTKSGKKLKIRSYPQFDNLEQERLYRKQHLAAAFRVFADRGFDEGVAGKHIISYLVVSQCYRVWVTWGTPDGCDLVSEKLVEVFGGATYLVPSPDHPKSAALTEHHVSRPFYNRD